MNSRQCPKCGSVRIRHSHVRGVTALLLSTLGAEINRCHSCRSRQAWWGDMALCIGENRRKSRWSAGLVLCAGFGLCLGVLWWMITRVSELSG